MRERFTGKALIEALMRQDLISCDPKAARAIAGKCTVVDIKQGVRFIKEGDSTSDVFLILQGTADISVKGTLVATRNEGQHVGEMASLLNARRTATVTARGNIVAAKIARKQFLALGEKFPNIWRGVARTLAMRLDQRRNLIREPNIRPLIFIASASESKAVADKLKEALTDPRWDIEVWHEPQVFPPSSTILPTLVDKAKKSDFGIAVFGRDDKTNSRKKDFDSPRDNTVLEGGLFVGSVGLERTYFVVPDGKRFKEPTDLKGVVTPRYKRSIRNIDIAHAAKQIRLQIEKLMTR